MNVHGLFTNRSDSDQDDDNSNNRYVGGVSVRGGGSGLAVEPNTSEPSILNAIRANATEESSSEAAASASSDNPRRTITLYRSSFSIDDGPERRLDDPANASFLKDLAKGVVPKELQNDAAVGGEATVGLIDKRQMEYSDDPSRGNGGLQSSNFTSFAGEGQSLGGESTLVNSNGVITPSASMSSPPPLDDSSPKTIVQVRLLCGKRLRIEINKSSKILVLVQHMNESGQAGTEDYILSSGFPPKTLDDLEKSIEECGLAGSQVIQKKA